MNGIEIEQKWNMNGIEMEDTKIGELFFYGMLKWETEEATMALLGWFTHGDHIGSIGQFGHAGWFRQNFMGSKWKTG